MNQINSFRSIALLVFIFVLFISVSFYSNSNDVFTVLRLVHAMDDDKKVFIGDPTKTGNTHFDQLFIVTSKKPKISYDAIFLINKSYLGQKMVLRKFLVIGTFYHK